MTTKEEITDILNMQQKIYKDAVGMLFSCVTQRVDDQFKLLQELRTSLEFSQSEVASLKNELKDAKKQIDDSKNLLSEQSSTIKTLYSKIDKLESYSRRNNVRIDGVTELNNENYQQTQQKVHRLLREKLQLQDIKIETAHRLPRPTTINGGQPRTIIAKLSSTTDKEETMKNKHKLKGTGVFINEDLSEGTMKIRQEKLPELQAARNAGKIAYFRREKLIIKDKKHENTREQTSSSSIQAESTTPPPSNVSNLIQTFTPQTGHDLASANKPLDLGTSEGHTETENENTNREKRQTRNQSKNKKI